MFLKSSWLFTISWLPESEKFPKVDSILFISFFASSISLVGFSDALETKVNYDILEKENNYFRFIMLHEPDEYEKIKEYDFDIMFAGHSHNGQVRLPLIGTIYTPVGSKK